MAETLQVSLGERSYPIYFGPDLTADIRAEAARAVARGCRVAVLTDANVARAQSDALRAMLSDAPVLTVEPGEGAKSLRGFGRVVDFLAQQQVDRAGILF